jgi:hypothetical protein
MSKQEIVGDVLREQTPKQLYVVRGKLYELLTNCIPPEVIFRHLTVELLRKLDDELRHKVWHQWLHLLLPDTHVALCAWHFASLHHLLLAALI